MNPNLTKIGRKQKSENKIGDQLHSAKPLNLAWLVYCPGDTKTNYKPPLGGAPPPQTSLKSKPTASPKPTKNLQKSSPKHQKKEIGPKINLFTFLGGARCRFLTKNKYVHTSEKQKLSQQSTLTVLFVVLRNTARGQMRVRRGSKAEIL